ncbi:uncharacterized protein LOC144115699 [Amblyomma americanum]
MTVTTTEASSGADGQKPNDGGTDAGAATFETEARGSDDQHTHSGDCAEPSSDVKTPEFEKSEGSQNNEPGYSGESPRNLPTGNQADAAATAVGEPCKQVARKSTAENIGGASAGPLRSPAETNAGSERFRQKRPPSLILYLRDEESCYRRVNSERNQQNPKSAPEVLGHRHDSSEIGHSVSGSKDGRDDRRGSGRVSGEESAGTISDVTSEAFLASDENSSDEPLGGVALRLDSFRDNSNRRFRPSSFRPPYFFAGVSLGLVLVYICRRYWS